MKKVKILALVSAIITALLLLVFLSSLSQPTDNLTKVISAATDIPANTPITAEMLTTNDMPAASVSAGAITDSSQVVGKVSQTKIFAGEQLLSSKLVSAGEENNNSLAYAIEPGMRAITISVDQTSGVAYLLTPSDRVDVIGDFLDESGGTKISYSKIILENIKILAVDNVYAEGGKINSEASAYTALTLQVTPAEALKLSMGQFEGQLRVILRSPVDEKKTNLPRITLNEVIK